MKLSARVFVAAAAVLVFLASCGQLIGDFEVVKLPNQVVVEPNGPEVICTLGVTRCEGRLLQLCVDEGTAWTTLEPCATAELCESSDVSTVSSCIKPTCGDEQMSCEGAELRLCNASRTGWEPFATCESAAHCDAGNRQCLAAPCEPGARRCNVGNLERCNDASTAWEPLDTCVTNDLCEQTLAPPAVVGEILTTGQVPAPPPPSDAEGPTSCRQPECVPREVRCDLSRLNACNEGQTDLELAEECATPKLCDASITYTGLRGSPRCVRPLCAVGEHRCSPEGVLELCNLDRDGYDPIEACIGAPFCNAVAADNGLPGCEDAPCDPGEEQCNGPQIQRCLADQTGFEPVGAACETRGLCNDDNPTAFCAAAACQRGPFSGSEFRCQGATLQRCNDQHTGYDTLSSCATPGLCNAGLGFNGCQPPACAPGETRCSGNFVQVCNEQRTTFVNVEQCAQGTCDSTAGRCADPCIEGSARCNAQGNLEECRSRLNGWEITARCGSVQLCDPGARACRAPPAGCTADGVRRCRPQGAGSVLEVCSDGRSRFATLDTCAAGEFCDANDVSCDACIAGSEPACSGNDLVSCSTDGKQDIIRPCPNGCQTVTNGPDRCRTCVPGSVSCSGEQLVVCRQRGSEEFLDREDCDSAALCQNTVSACNANGDGQNCRCAPGVCSPGDRACDGSQPVICNADQTGFVDNGPDCVLEENCNDAPVGECFACQRGDVSCSAAGVMQGCLTDRSGFGDLQGAPFPGDERCIRDNRGQLAQSCNGAQLVEDICGSNEICADGLGCVECDPRAPFTSTCTTVNGRQGRTLCMGGDIVAVECPLGNGCTDFACQGGACNEVNLDEGSQCQLPGGGDGLCDGDPKCVECINNPDCGPGRFCNDGVCGACQTGSAECQGQALRICDASGTFVTQETCDGATECNTAEQCDAVGRRCAPRQPAAGTCTQPNNQPGVCSGGFCGAPQICDVDDRRCVGANLEVCNAARTGFELDESCFSAAHCAVTGCVAPCENDDCNFGCNDQRTGCNRCDGNVDRCPDVGLPPCTLSVCANGGLSCETQQECAADRCVANTCVQCTVDGQCGNGQVCNDQNECEAAPVVVLPGCLGDPSQCVNDNNACNGVETCNQAGVCDRIGAMNCNNGDACDGLETCVAPGTCVGGTPPCNANTQTCNGGVCTDIPVNTGGSGNEGGTGGEIPTNNAGADNGGPGNGGPGGPGNGGPGPGGPDNGGPDNGGPDNGGPGNGGPGNGGPGAGGTGNETEGGGNTGGDGSTTPPAEEGGGNTGGDGSTTPPAEEGGGNTGGGASEEPTEPAESTDVVDDVADGSEGEAGQTNG